MSQDDLKSTMRETFGRIDLLTSREMPKYRCHKEVRALKIKAIRKVSTEVHGQGPAEGGKSGFSMKKLGGSGLGLRGKAYRVCGKDSRLGGRHCRFSGKGRWIGGRASRHCGNHYQLGGGDSRLSGQDCPLSGKTCRLGGKGRRVHGRHCRFSGRIGRKRGNCGRFGGKAGWHWGSLRREESKGGRGVRPKVRSEGPGQEVVRKEMEGWPRTARDKKFRPQNQRLRCLADGSPFGPFNKAGLAWTVGCFHAWTTSLDGTWTTKKAPWQAP